MKIETVNQPNSRQSLPKKIIYHPMKIVMCIKMKETSIGTVIFSLTNPLKMNPLSLVPFHSADTSRTAKEFIKGVVFKDYVFQLGGPDTHSMWPFQEDVLLPYHFWVT